MKPHLLAALAAGLVLSTTACSQLPGGGGSTETGAGPGPANGYGGPMYGYGGGPGDDGFGPGMMGGYGWGPGPGMMGGYGWGPGPGMMGGGPRRGWGPNIPDLTDQQRARIADIQKEYRQKQWALMQSMHELNFQSGGPGRGGGFDEQAARKAFEARENLRRQMFENSLQMRKRVDEVLTPKQREQMQRGWGNR